MAGAAGDFRSRKFLEPMTKTLLLFEDGLGKNFRGGRKSILSLSRIVVNDREGRGFQLPWKDGERAREGFKTLVCFSRFFLIK